MADQCPACEREFRCLEDYPLIYIATFNKGDIPAELEFPFLDPTTFVEPSSKFCNEKVPAKVLGLFKKNKEAKEIKYNGWTWRELERGAYQRQQDQRAVIIARLNPYFESLDSLVGKEIPKEDLLPKFPRHKRFYNAFQIPDSAYQFMFLERGETPAGLRIAEIHIMGSGINLGSAGGPTLQSRAKVGHLEYEGRVRK